MDVYRTVYRLAAAIGLAACVAGAWGATIEYVPDDGGMWSEAYNWSLGRCPQANDDVYIEVSGNDDKAVTYNWTGSTGFGDLTVDGEGSYYGAIWHLDNDLSVDDYKLGRVGEAWHWMEGDAYLHASGTLYVGHYGAGLGRFYLDAPDGGVQCDGNSYVGYSAEGEFEHLNGYHYCEHLFVGQNDPGYYEMKGPTATSTLQTEYYMVVGNADEGTFEQTGGTVNPDSPENVFLGLNTGGEGTYLMRGGVLNAGHITIGWNGNGYFTQSGGEVNLDTNLNIGADGTHPQRVWYKVTDDDDEPTLNIGGNMHIGQYSLGKYEQLGSGTVEVAGSIEIYDGDDDPYSSSFLYMGLNADWLGAGAVHNISGYYDQDGGTLNTQEFVNDSEQGVNLDNNAEARIRYFTNNAGTVYMLRNAWLRGPHAFGSVYWICDFTNEAGFQMGSVAGDGGTFYGTLTNNGTFTYYQGDFSSSTLINNGEFEPHAAFTCRRMEQHAAFFTATADHPIRCEATNNSTAFVNTGNMTIEDDATITVVGAPFVNSRAIFGAGTIDGDFENNGNVWPTTAPTETQDLDVTGDYVQGANGGLRINLSGEAATTEYDRLVVGGRSYLAGTLEVRLIDGFTPELGDVFDAVRSMGGIEGVFESEMTPALEAGLAWDVSYDNNRVRLTVVEAHPCPGDLNGDGAVNLSDLAQLLGNYGTTSGAAYEDGDMDDDGDVDLADLAALLAYYGTEC